MREVKLLPCPRCGRQPKLRHTSMHSGRSYGCAGELLIGKRYTCRGLLGIFTCTDAPYTPVHGNSDGWHWNVKDWADLAERRAAETWNELAAPRQ